MGPLQLLRKLGLTGVYHGTGITLVRDIPSFGVYFLVYKVLLSLSQRCVHLWRQCHTHAQ